MENKFFLWLTGIFVFLILLTGCKQNDNELKIGVLAPLTGPLAKYGEDMRRGFDMALEDFDAQDNKVRLVYEDVTCLDVKQATTALNKLKSFDEVRAFLGSFCGHIIKSTAEFSTMNGIFSITPGDNFGKIGDYIISSRYLLEKEARLLGEYALSKGWKNLAVLYLNNDWGIGYKDGINSYLETNDGKVIATESYFWDNLDVRTQLIKIKEKNPDALFIIDGTAQGVIFRQIKELGLELPLLSEWQVEDWGKEVDKSVIEGVYYFAPVIEEDSLFRQRFKEKYGVEAYTLSIDSYDAAIILSEALENCEKENYDAQCMTDYVTNLKDYEGAGGKLTFDKETWSFDKPFQLKTVKNGEFVVLD